MTTTATEAETISLSEAEALRRAMGEANAQAEAEAERQAAMERTHERMVRQEDEARATAWKQEGCHETDRPEWWNEEGEGDDIELEAKARAEMTEDKGPEAQEKEARTAEITA